MQNNYAQIRTLDISNGPGCRVSIFLQGCPFHCKNCFNQSTWNPAGGKPFTEETLDRLLKLIEPDYIDGISILGGEPLWDPYTVPTTAAIVRSVREKFPHKSIWIWTGFRYGEIAHLPFLKDVDVIVDGQYDDSKRDASLVWRGSSNQRILDARTGVLVDIEKQYGVSDKKRWGQNLTSKQ